MPPAARMEVHLFVCQRHGYDVSPRARELPDEEGSAVHPAHQGRWRSVPRLNVQRQDRVFVIGQCCAW